MYPVRIPVLERLDVPKSAEAMAPTGRWEECWLREGRAFEVSANGSGFPKPEGICSWADIQRDVIWAALGGVQPDHKHLGNALTCCTDGFNPVVFLVERLDSAEEVAP